METVEELKAERLAIIEAISEMAADVSRVEIHEMFDEIAENPRNRPITSMTEITKQQLKDWESTFGRLLREDDIERTRNILLGVLIGAGLLLVCYIALLMINAIDNAYQSYYAHQMLIQSETHYNASQK